MITDEQVLDALIESLRERGPDFRYVKEEGLTNCTYSTADGEPSCLVGMVLRKIAPEHFVEVAKTERVEIEESKGNGSPSPKVYGMGATTVTGGLELSNESLVLLTNAQTAQDTGNTYRKVASIIKVEAF